MVATLIGAALLGASIYQGEQAARAQRTSLRESREANAVALAEAERRDRLAAEEAAKLNRKAPDIGAILSAQLSIQNLNQQTTLAGDNAGLLGASLLLVDPQRGLGT